MAPASTASSDLPPLDNIFQASALTAIPLSQVETTMGFVVPSWPLANDLVADNNGAVSAEMWRNFLLLSIIGLAPGRAFI